MLRELHDGIRALGQVRLGTWLRVAAWSVAVGAAIAIPAVLVPNDFFRRMTPTRPQDYVFWVVASLLAGLVLGLRAAEPGRADMQAVGGGIGTALAVGCPVCNKIVVALIGVSGATTVFAPLQPVLGLASLVLLAVALRQRLRNLANPACTLDRATTPA